MDHLTQIDFDRYLDGDLDAGRRAELDSHLALCSICTRELENLRQVFESLQGLEDEPIPLDLTPRVLAQLPSSRQATHLGMLLFGVQAVLAMLLVLWVAPVLLNGIAAGIAPFLPSGILAAFFPNQWQNPLGTNGSGLLSPLSFLTPLQWLLLVAGVAILWLVSNRFLLAGISRRRRELEETA